MTQAPPRLEPLELAQAEVLAALHARCFAAGWDQEALRTLLVAPSGFGTLAIDAINDEPIGFVLGRVIAQECEILTIGVIPGARKRGIGMHLVKRLFADAWARGAERVLLEVADDNAAGLALYGAAGFTVVGRRPGYYRRNGNAIDAHIMQRLKPTETDPSDNPDDQTID